MPEPISHSVLTQGGECGMWPFSKLALYFPPARCMIGSSVHTCINIHVHIHIDTTETPIQWVLGHSNRYRGHGMVFSVHPHLLSRFQKEQSYTSILSLCLHSRLCGELSLFTTGTLFIMTTVSSHFQTGCLNLYISDMYQSICLLRCNACL